MFFFSPALGAKSFKSYLARWYPYLKQPLRLGDWLKQTNETDYSRYSSSHWQGILQSMLIMRRAYKLVCDKAMQKIISRTPILMFLSKDDETVSAKRALKWFVNKTSPESTCIYYSNPISKFSNSRIIFRTSYYPKEKVLNFSHTCLQHSPENMHYGLTPDYYDYKHYPANSENTKTNPETNVTTLEKTRRSRCTNCKKHKT